MTHLNNEYAAQHNTDALKLVDHCWACDFTFYEYLSAALNSGLRIISKEQYIARCRVNEAKMIASFRADATSNDLDQDLVY